MYQIDTIHYSNSKARAEMTNFLLNQMKNILVPPIVVCIGTDRVAGDSLGPLVGHLLVNHYNLPTYVYGTLSSPVTSKNVESVKRYLDFRHRNAPILAVDAGVGQNGTLGDVRVINDGIYPGLALKRVLPKIGTHAMVGIVCDDSYMDATVLAQTKIKLVYDMARLIAGSISDLFTFKYSVCSDSDLS